MICPFCSTRMRSAFSAAERANAELIDNRRKLRIAKGSGRPVEEVNRLVKQFLMMKNMMKRTGLLGRMMSGAAPLTMGMPGFRAPARRGSNYTPPKKKRRKH